MDARAARADHPGDGTADLVWAFAKQNDIENCYRPGQAQWRAAGASRAGTSFFGPTFDPQNPYGWRCRLQAASLDGCGEDWHAAADASRNGAAGAGQERPGRLEKSQRHRSQSGKALQRAEVDEQRAHL